MAWKRNGTKASGNSESCDEPYSLDSPRRRDGNDNSITFVDHTKTNTNKSIGFKRANTHVTNNDKIDEKCLANGIQPIRFEPDPPAKIRKTGFDQLPILSPTGTTKDNNEPQNETNQEGVTPFKKGIITVIILKSPQTAMVTFSSTKCEGDNKILKNNIY